MNTAIKTSSGRSRKNWDFHLVKFLLQHASQSIIHENLTQALSTFEVSASLASPLQALVKRLFSLCPPLTSKDFPVLEETVVTRWLLLSYGGKDLWNVFAKMALKQIKIVDGVIEEEGGLEKCKGEAKWLWYYWEVMAEDFIFSTIGGPLLEGEEVRGGVEVRISTFRKGDVEGVEWTYERLFEEIRRVVCIIKGVRDRSKKDIAIIAAASTNVAEQGDRMMDDNIDTSRSQFQQAATTTTNFPPTVSKSNIIGHTEEVSSGSTEEELKKFDVPELSEPPSEEQVSHHVAEGPAAEHDKTIQTNGEYVDEPNESDEPADIQDPKFYEASDHWSDNDSEGSDEIPWAPLNERNAVIREQSDPEIETWETIQISEGDGAAVTVDDVSGETMDDEQFDGTEGERYIFRDQSPKTNVLDMARNLRTSSYQTFQFHSLPSRERLSRANKPPEGLFSAGPQHFSMLNPPQQPQAGVFQIPPTLNLQSTPTQLGHPSSSHLRDPSGSQSTSGNHGSHAHSSRESEPDKGKVRAINTSRGNERRRVEEEEEEEEKRLVLAWDREFSQGIAARGKDTAHNSKQQPPRPTILPTLQNRKHPNQASHTSQQAQPQEFCTYQNRPQEVSEVNYKAHAVIAGYPKITMASWRTNLPGPNTPALSNVQPRKSILKKRSEEEFSQMGRGRPKREPREKREVSFTRSSKYDDGGRDAKDFMTSREDKDQARKEYEQGDVISGE